MILVNGCECGAVLAHDQRYCVECGRTVARFQPNLASTAPAPAAAQSRFGIPVPPQLATMVAAATLGFGLAIGTALDPNLPFLAAAETPAPVVEEIAAAPDPTPPEASGSGRAGGGGGASARTVPSTGLTLPAEPPPLVPPPVDPPPDAPPPPGPPPGDDGGVELTGVVVGANPLAESYSVASGGALTSIHAEELPVVGTKLSVEIDPLFNGTYEEASERDESGVAEEATFAGVVTATDEAARSYVVSSGGASRLVHMPDGSEEELPPLSASITVDAALVPADPTAPQEQAPEGSEPQAEGRCPAEQPSPAEPLDRDVSLEQQSLQIDFESFASASAGAIVQAACPEEGLLRISADDVRESGTDLIMAVDEGIDTSLYEPGEPVAMVVDVSVVEDGEDPLIRGIAGDLGIEGASDTELGQGEKADASLRRARREARRRG